MAHTVPAVAAKNGFRTRASPRRRIWPENEKGMPGTSFNTTDSHRGSLVMPGTVARRTGQPTSFLQPFGLAVASLRRILKP